MKKTGDLAIEAVLDSSSFAGEETPSNECSDHDVKPLVNKQVQCAPLSLSLEKQTNSNGRPKLQSWASEMSLYDMLSPRRSMENIKFPSTPKVVPTPKEFKGMNWKRMTFESCGSTVRKSMADQNVDKLIVEEEEEVEVEQERTDEGARSSYSARDGTMVGEPGRFEMVEEVPAELSKSPSSNKSDVSSVEPIFDHKNLLVNYLPPDMDTMMLRDLFRPHGNIVSCKVVVDHGSGLSKGYGFVKFQNAEEGIKAKNALHEHRIGRKTLKVSFSRRPQGGEKTKHHTNLYLSNLDPLLEQEDLERHFKTCGYVVQCKVLKNAQGKSKQIGFVRFDNAESARRAIEKYDGRKLEGTDRPIKIRIAGTPRAPPGREALQTHTFVASLSPASTPPRVYQASSACYVAGFNVAVSEKVLRRVFEANGSRRVKSVRIIRRQNGPYAFVNFFDCEEAAEAARTLNNKMLDDCTLTVRLQS